METHEMALNEL